MYFDSCYREFGDGFIKAKAIDDRVGCEILLRLINSDLPYSATFCFSVQEEIGTRGAAAAAYSVAPDFAIVVEGTTAADISGVPDEKKVCRLGGGAVVSFMDRGTVYDSELYKKAFEIAEKERHRVSDQNRCGRRQQRFRNTQGGRRHKNSCRICSVQIHSLGQLGCGKRGYREHV